MSDTSICYVEIVFNTYYDAVRKYNLHSPFLLGESMSGDVIHEAVQKSWIDRQLRFDFGVTEK